MKVINSIKCYEINGKEIKALPFPELTVKGHWNRNTFVVLEFVCSQIIQDRVVESKMSCTVSASELIKAVHNSTNT